MTLRPGFAPNVLQITKMTTNKPLPLKLYTFGRSPNSTQARRNLEAICEAHFLNRFSIEVIDLSEQSHRAIEDGIMLTPTMIIGSSLPVTVIGDLSDASNVIDLLRSSSP